MKVCMITRTYPPRIGGTGSVVQRVSKGLVENGFEVSVVCTRVAGAQKFENDSGVSIYRTLNMSDSDEFTFSNLGVSSAAMISKIVSFRDYDVFHAHDISVAGFSGCIAKRFVRKPFFLKYGGDLVLEYLSLRNHGGWDYRQGLEGTRCVKGMVPGMMRSLQGWYFRSYDKVLPNSVYGRDFLVGSGVPEEKVSVLVNGVDTLKFAPCKDSVKTEVRRKYGYGDSKRMVLAAGRMVPWKGFDVLIRAFAQVSEDAVLVLAGDGPELMRLKMIAHECGVESRVVFPGNVSRDGISDYFAMCDVFVLPSYFEAAPNVLLEAMASGCACVVSDIGGVAEIVERGSALAAHAGDVDGFAEKINIVLCDRFIAHRMALCARKRILERYSWKNVLLDYIRLYESV